MGKYLFRAAASIILLSLYLLWNNYSAMRSPEEIARAEIDLVKDRCLQPEAVDRDLLQQSWFYDREYTRLAGAFAQHSFSLYDPQDTDSMPTTGAFCIDGSKLHVKYYKTHPVPVSINIFKLRVQLGTKLKPLAEDTFMVKELDAKHMVLFFSSDSKEHRFYRKR